MTRREALIRLRAQIDAELAHGHRIRRREIEHGTDSGYHWHRRHKVPFVEACGCKEAHAAYEKSRAIRKAA